LRFLGFVNVLWVVGLFPENSCDDSQKTLAKRSGWFFGNRMQSVLVESFGIVSNSSGIVLIFFRMVAWMISGSGFFSFFFLFNFKFLLFLTSNCFNEWTNCLAKKCLQMNTTYRWIIKRQIKSTCSPNRLQLTRMLLEWNYAQNT